jgi:hypothetical protein
VTDRSCALLFATNTFFSTPQIPPLPQLVKFQTMYTDSFPLFLLLFISPAFVICVSLLLFAQGEQEHGVSCLVPTLYSVSLYSASFDNSLGGKAAHDMACYFGLICSHSVWGSFHWFHFEPFRIMFSNIFICLRMCHDG